MWYNNYIHLHFNKFSLKIRPELQLLDFMNLFWYNIYKL